MSQLHCRNLGAREVTVVTRLGFFIGRDKTQQMVSQQEQNPVTENWHRRMWRLALPMIVSNISIPLLGMVDTAVVGHLPDPAYLGGVAIGALIFSYVYWGLGFLRMSTTGLTAQSYGERGYQGVYAVLLRAGIMAIGFAAAILLLQSPIALLAFGLLSGSDQVELFGAQYFSIRIWGAPAALATFVFLGWFLGQEDAKTPLILQVIINGVNIVFDLIFVIGLDWGVEGVAAATLIAEYSGLLLGGFFVIRRLSLIGERPRLDLSLLAFQDFKAMIAINRDIFIRTFCLTTAFALFTARSAQMGDVILAANTVLMNFLTIASHVLDAFAHAAEALVGAAKGRRDRAAFHAASMVAFQWGALVAVASTLLFFAFGPFLIDLLTGIEEVRVLAKDHMVWAAMMPVLAIWCFTLDGIFIGATRSADLRNGMLVTLAIYLAALYLLENSFGMNGLWAAVAVLMILRGVTLAVRYPALLRSIA